MNRRNFQKLALARLKDAEVLLSNGRYDAAYYLAGYAVECGLKACIAKQTMRHDFPRKDLAKIYTHKIGHLLEAAKLDQVSSELSERDREFYKNLSAVQKWTEESRYHAASEEDARELVKAILDRKHGVLYWLSQHWSDRRSKKVGGS